MEQYTGTTLLLPLAGKTTDLGWHRHFTLYMLLSSEHCDQGDIVSCHTAAAKLNTASELPFKHSCFIKQMS